MRNIAKTGSVCVLCLESLRMVDPLTRAATGSLGLTAAVLKKRKVPSGLNADAPRVPRGVSQQMNLLETTC